MNNSDKILSLLKKKYPFAAIALRAQNPWQLLVSTILSSQCTDERVNRVTKGLFKKYKRVEDYAKADIREFETDIRSTGFYRNKAKNIIASAKMVIAVFKAAVPDTMDELIKLPGVARKTANVVLFNAFGKNEGVAVDTHVSRLSQRLGLTPNKDPVKIEKDLMQKFERKEWGVLTLCLIQHGRDTCMARKPLCFECCLKNICPSKKIFYPKG